MGSIEDEYEPLEVIGKGSFGTVRKVRQKDNGNILVRKEIEYTSMNNQEKNHIISELRILRELDHPNIVRYLRHDHLPGKKAIHIYQEYCDGGDLGKVIQTFKKNKESVPEEFIWEVMVQMLLALHRCHYGINAKKVNLFTGRPTGPEPKVNSETVIIHRDIKPDNIFLLDSGKTAKLGDFGLAKMLTSQNEFAKTYVGTPYYMSPEVLMDNPYSPVCDIWSLGCVLYELCTLHPPFQASTHLQLQARIKTGEIPEISSAYSQQLRSIIYDSITVDPADRPSCYDLLENLSIKMFRKEMDLKNANSTLNEFQKQLLIKNEELKKREMALRALESKVQTQRDELEEEYDKLQMECARQKKSLENELLDEFEMRKRQMDQEAKEMRLNYQREFKHVVEQEVQQRLSEIIQRRGTLDGAEELIRKNSQNSDTSSSASSERYRTNMKPKGPRELVEEKLTFQPQNLYQPHTYQQHSPQQVLQHTTQQQQQQLKPQNRLPLKTKNNEWEMAHPKLPPSRPVGPQTTSSYKKRITDEFERLNLQKRNIPEFEERYLRQNNRH
ncbi:Protein kinase domain family protein [Clavispora lusitaniae]|uniref:Protein kinase domain family protein n=1 Tax=Clavispora lusitaniae TaxID=36911 RepID=UPI0016BA5DB2|nr:G2-specific serine/threonine protein kinase [Clavispora lusitaniae]KAF7580721.1 Protein kinase domain family protein [Clavispora lusitaniae]